MSRAEYMRKWKAANPERVRAINQKYYAAHRNQCLSQGRKRYRKNRPKYLAMMRRWKENNPDKSSEGLKNWRKRNPDYTKRYHKDNPSAKVAHQLRNRLRAVVGRKHRSRSALKLLGCSLNDFWIYLESRFEQGMTRENYGRVWHLDHIIPCALFDLSIEDHQKRCFHFSNLQPLFALENLQKHTTIYQKIVR